MSTEFETQVNVEMLDDSVLGNVASISPVIIKWSLDFEMRSWGLKGVDAFVPEQKVMLVYTVWDESGENEIDQEKEVLLADVQIDLDNVQITHGMAPQTLEFYQGKVAVVF